MKALPLAQQDCDFIQLSPPAQTQQEGSFTKDHQRRFSEKVTSDCGLLMKRGIKPNHMRGKRILQVEERVTYKKSLGENEHIRDFKKAVFEVKVTNG